MAYHVFGKNKLEKLRFSRFRVVKNKSKLNDSKGNIMIAQH